MLEFVLIGKCGGVVIQTVPGDPWQSWGAPRVSWITLVMLRRKGQHRQKHQERMPRGWALAEACWLQRARKKAPRRPQWDSAESDGQSLCHLVQHLWALWEHQEGTCCPVGPEAELEDARPILQAVVTATRPLSLSNTLLCSNCLQPDK